MIRINQIKLPVTSKESELNKKISKILKTESFTLERIVKKSIDAREKDKLMYIYSVDVSVQNETSLLKKLKDKNIAKASDICYSFPKHNVIYDKRPVIVGAGPAGYFCALYLARAGFKPIVLERGRAVEERTKDVLCFWNNGKLNPESNVSFGEGGAGTFSDGKLNTGIKDKHGRIEAVINDFIAYGAPEDIAYTNKPHIGTDMLKIVLKNMREDIIRLGGIILFETKFTGYEKTGKYIRVYADLIGEAFNYKEYVVKTLIDDADIELISDERLCIDTDALVLAIGHSARDTFKALHSSGLPMEAKAFAMGLRIEHKASLINEAQYGKSEAAKSLPTASYKMTFRSSEGRSVYSFCMCPGGFVVNASSDENQSVVNGMSNHERDEENSNSAIVVNVTPEDFINDGFGDYGVLAGMEFQKKYEKRAYELGNGCIPVQRFGDFKEGKESSSFGEITPNIKGGYTMANLNNCLPKYVNNAIIEGINYYGTKLRGFDDDDAVLSGVESRTSSPVRILRDDTLMSEVEGIYPCGEGAGYAGGITSAAVDGIKVAEAIAIRHRDKESNT